MIAFSKKVCLANAFRGSDTHFNARICDNSASVMFSKDFPVSFGCVSGTANASHPSGLQETNCVLNFLTLVQQIFLSCRKRTRFGTV